LPVFVPVAYAAIAIAFVRSIQVWRDSFNPLCLICAIGFLRHLLPAAFLLNGAELPETVRLFFQAMKLTDDDWLWGHALALMGLVAAVVGWNLVQPFKLQVARARLNFSLGPGVKPAAFVGMLVGFAALSVFLVSNASLDVISSGAFRGTTIQSGTGKYFFVAYLLIAGSVLLSCYYLANGRTLLALLPVVSATLFYWILGGRNRAVVSLTAGLLLLWYLHRQKKGWPKITLTNPYIVIAPFVICSVIWVSYVGALYRGEMGARVFSEGLSFQGLREYLAASIFTDLGQLHSLAGAIAIGPGVLGGQTFLGALTWPLNKLVFIPGRSAGVFIVETLVGFMTEDDKWAVNASLIGDAYLNLGLWGVPIVMALYGAVAKAIYLKFRQGRVQATVYVLALICGLQMSWASIEVWPQTLTLLVFTRGLIFAGETVFQVSRQRFSGRRVGNHGN
jgi:oligosaccharide repeat unit polymerase